MNESLRQVIKMRKSANNLTWWPVKSPLTHSGRVTHICVGKLTIIGSDNGLSPGRRQAIIWTNAGILSIRPLGTKFSEILSEIQAFSFKKMHVNMSSAKRRPFCLGLNMLRRNIGVHCEYDIWIKFILVETKSNQTIAFRWALSYCDNTSQ